MFSEAYQRAWTAFTLGRYDLCQECLIDGLSGDPNNVDMLELLSQVHVATGRYESGREIARTVIQLDPEHPGGFRMLAWAIILDSKYSPDDPKFDPVSSDNRVALKARIKQARELTQRSLEIDPEDPYHYSLLAEVEFLSDNPEEALEAARKGLHVDASHGPCAHQRMRALQELRRFDEAVETGFQRLTIHPDDATCHFQLSRTFLAKGDRDSATRHARVAVQLDPQRSGHRELYWDTIKAQNPLFRPIVYWQFFAARLARIPDQLKIIGLIGLPACAGLAGGIAEKYYGIENISLWLLVVIAIFVGLVASERPCMAIVDLIMYMTDREYRAAIDGYQVAISATTTLFAITALVSVGFASIGVMWPLFALVGAFFLGIPGFCVLCTESLLWKSILVCAIVIAVALIWIGVPMYQNSVPNSSERMNAIFVFLGVIATSIGSAIAFLLLDDKRVQRRSL